MKKMLPLLTAMSLLLTSCAETPEQNPPVLMGREWFMPYDTVKTLMNSYPLLQERESAGEKIPQKMQDYTDVSLFGYACDLTLCFTEAGLIGLNYHDVEKNQNYREWFSVLESEYGLPDEQGSGLSSWYGNPAGKNTAVYLFNLEEGVQISVYATSDSPDRSYEKPETGQIPSPEIRTPIVLPDTVPETAESFTSATETGNIPEYSVFSEISENTESLTEINFIQETSPEENPELTEILTGTEIQETSETSVNITESVTELLQEETVQDSLLNGLEFYGSPDQERRKMRDIPLYEYRTEEPGQPWEYILEYENISCAGEICNCVLCFTSLGLVGINYFDSDLKSYDDWSARLTELYGRPDEVQQKYSVWEQNPAGEGTVIYIFALEDGVQISFFADDTGSELS